MVLFPSVMIPSTGIFSPGFTLTISPFLMSCIEITFSSPSITNVASVGANFNSSLIAPLVLLCALASNNCPNNTKVKTTVVASKYKWTVPSEVLNWSGKTVGNNNPIILKTKATPVPIPIKVNMFKFQLIMDFHALSKNIQQA